MKADVLLLAAGLGTRLRPLTNNCPKPLLEVGGKPLIQWNLERIIKEGFEKIFINLHYQAALIKKFLQAQEWEAELVIVEEQEKILDTGGAVKNIESELSSNTLLVINSDTLFGSEFSLTALLKAHTSNTEKPLATMVLRKDPKVQDYGIIGINQKGKVITFRGEKFYDEVVTAELMFSGNSVLSKEILGYMPPRGSVFSLTRDTFRKVLINKEVIWSNLYQGYWNDVGTLEALEKARQDFALGLIS